VNTPRAAAPSIRPRYWIAFLAAYTGVLLSLTWARPLWLDEILELLITREDGFRSRLEMIRETPGAVPLGYEVQHVVTRVLGESVFSARLPSELFALVSLCAMLWLAREIQVRGRVFLALVWTLLPILLRYALEGRGYSQALALSAASTLVFFRLLRDPRASIAALYAALVFAAISTQPYSLFLQVGLLAPLVFERRKPLMRRALILGGISIACAVLAFAPWVFWSGHNWTQYASRIKQEFHLTARLPLLLIREISGGSYFCSLGLLTFAVAGSVSRRMNPLTKRQLLTGIGACVALALAGDLTFHYFFATRQVLFTLVPLCLLAGEGWAEAAWRGPYLRSALLTLFLVATVLKDFSYFRDRSENWKSAALRLEIVTRSACIFYPPNDLPQVYEYFEPALQDRKCEPRRFTDTVYLPVTRYTAVNDARAAFRELTSNGYSLDQVERAGEPIEIRKYGITRPAIPAVFSARPMPQDSRTPPPRETR
jgi:hypothetical protein